METIAKINTQTTPEKDFQVFRRANSHQHVQHRPAHSASFITILQTPVKQLEKLYSTLDIAPGGLKPDQVDTFLNISREASDLKKQVDHLIELINLRTQFSDQEERDRLKEKICRYPDDTIYEEALHKAQNRQRISDISIHVQTEPAKINPDHLRILVRELIQNAFDYSEHGEEVEVISKAEENRLVINIRDNGQGMSERKSELLNNKISEDSDGLGMHIVREILAFCEGRFNLFSIPGRGTTVTVSIPLA